MTRRLGFGLGFFVWRVLFAGVVCAVCPVQGHCALLGKVVVGCSRCCHCCLRWWVHLCSKSCFCCDVHAAPFCSMQGCCCNVSAKAVAVRERHLSQCWCPSFAVLKRCWPQQRRCQAHVGPFELVATCKSWQACATSVLCCLLPMTCFSFLTGVSCCRWLCRGQCSVCVCVPKRRRE
jgi:hypothetical protein